MMYGTYPTDDHMADFHRWEEEKRRWLDRLPKCEECGEHIQQDRAVCISDKYYCDDCLDYMRVDIGGDD